jgi:type IV pilus assembly protein PilQ
VLVLAAGLSRSDDIPLIDIDVRQVPITDVLYELALAAKTNLVLADDIDTQVSLVFNQIQPSKGLALICSGFSLTCKQTAQGLIVSQVADQSSMALLPMTQVKLNYVAADDMLSTLQNATALLSPQGQLLADSRTHQMLIYDEAARVTQLAQVIHQLDQPLDQLLIEGRIVIAKSDLGESRGLDFIGVLGNADGTSVKPLQSANLGLGFNSAGGSLQLGLIGAHVLLQLELAALEASGKMLTLAQPQILVQEGYTGSIETGQEVPYLMTTEAGQQQQWKQAVLGLTVTPRVLPHQQVQLDLLVMQDSIGDLLPNGELALNTHRLKTRAVVGLGQTLVLGGALYEQQLDRLLSNPLLAGLPLVGEWFQRRKHGTERFELLVFVTPRIVNP